MPSFFTNEKRAYGLFIEAENVWSVPEEPNKWNQFFKASFYIDPDAEGSNTVNLEFRALIFLCLIIILFSMFSFFTQKIFQHKNKGVQQ